MVQQSHQEPRLLPVAPFCHPLRACLCLLWVSYGYKEAAVLRASQPPSGSTQEEEKRQRLHCLESRQEYLPQGLPPPSDWPELREVVMLSGRAGRRDSLNGSVS